ncbi:TadE/TadG family type IV pilus assembly protein [Actinospongicola halichondriae]|uniref:TadE/TadG family type IV pilus assembly protein n=1 Tax=Actinospongicola halichondriae TaxID=3236844 RepID=UPI003D56D261
MTRPSTRSGRRPTRPGHREGGQATVELALGFPVILLGVLLVLQLALVARDQLLVVHATREAARAAAVEAHAGAARDAALAATTGLDPARLRVDADRIGDRVHVTVRYHARTTLPLVGVLLPDPDLQGSLAMRIEPQGQR